MSEPTHENSSREFADKAVQLLKEYSQTFRRMIHAAFKLEEETGQVKANASKGMKIDESARRRLVNRHNILTQVGQRIFPAATSFARVVSQRIEHGKMDDLVQAELKLRLAEFEGNLFSAQTAVNTSFPHLQ
jgi:hypothetical protein